MIFDQNRYNTERQCPWLVRLGRGALLLGVLCCATAQAVEVKVDGGRLRGEAAAAVTVFRGIPYAAAPVGRLRWRAPQPPAPWGGVRPALGFGAVCMQPAPPEAAMAPAPGTASVPGAASAPGTAPAAAGMSEDCLTLNVWSGAVEGPPKPVLVWIHGGSFIGGAGSLPVNDGSALARRGLVVVSLNYRLGRFGFFAHPALAATRPPDEPVANFGLMDQMAALRWVRRNIAAFGGNPGNVTIVGESSGGAAVLRLMIAPSARGLFHRAVVQSGNGRDLMPRLRTVNPDGLPSALDAGLAFARDMGMADADAAALRGMAAQDIVAAGSRTAIEGGPVIDGQLLSADVGESFVRGAQARVPLMVGFTALELPVPALQFEAVWARALELDADQRAAVAAAYDSDAAFRKQALSDVIFAEPARFLAAAHAAHGEPAYLYRFGVLARAVRKVFDGTPHARELAYVFGNLETLAWPTQSNDEARAGEVMDYWTAFARTGNPNGAGRATWPRYSRGHDRLLDLTNDGPVPADVPHRARMETIAGLYAGQAQALSAEAAF